MSRLVAKNYVSPSSATSGIQPYGATNPAPAVRQSARRRRARLRARQTTSSKGNP